MSVGGKQFRFVNVDGMGVIIYNGDDPMRYKADIFTFLRVYWMRFSVGWYQKKWISDGSRRFPDQFEYLFL